MRWINAKTATIGVVVVAVGFAVLFALKKGGEDATLIEVARGDVISETLITGTVKPARSAELSFNRSGVLYSFPATVGKTVGAGTVLASLKNETESAAIAEAQAALRVAETRLAEVLRGSRAEEINVKIAAVAEKETAFKNLTDKSKAIIADAYSASDEAVSRYADQLFLDDDTGSPRISFSSGNQNGVYEAQYRRVTAGESLKALRSRVSSGYAGSAVDALQATLEDLRISLNLFLSLDSVLNEGSGITASTLTSYKENVATARGKIVASLTATQNHLSALRESESALRKARSELTLAEAGSTAEEIRTAKEELSQAAAKLRSVQAAFEETLLRAPFFGRVTSRTGSVGETVAAGSNIATLEGAGGFIAEADVPEADIAKIKVGDSAAVTLDAYGSGVSFMARISEIEQSEKIVEGVSTYKTTLAFIENDARLRSGMTANISIITAKISGALSVPIRALERSNGNYTATIVNDGGARETREVAVGLRGSNGLVEIVSGLSEGERVLMPATK